MVSMSCGRCHIAIFDLLRFADQVFPLVEQQHVLQFFHFCVCNFGMGLGNWVVMEGIYTEIEYIGQSLFSD